MSSSCELFIGDYSILTQETRVIPESMLIFRESDKKIYSIKDEDNEEQQVIEYSNTVENIRQRLNVLGYSLEKIKIKFEIEKSKILNDFEEEEDSGEEWYRDYQKERKTKFEILKNSTFDDWGNAFSVIHKSKLRRIYSWQDDSSAHNNFSPLIRYILSANDNNDIFYNFPGGDILSVVRLFLENCSPIFLVRLDISDLVGAGYYEADQSVCSEALTALTENYPVYEKIVVLTEGSTDGKFLQKSLELLFPHLSEYYSFMDVASSKAGGGASSLVKSVRSFAGSGISNRIIAIFDNDTEGIKQKEILLRKELPKNIKVMNYPDTDFAREYPASGVSSKNINGLACSIELYLGSDVLKKGGEIMPIKWGGFDDLTKKYQGEISNKTEVQKNFQKKINECTKNPSLLLTTDWNELKIVWNEIFKVFES
ncbi:MAG: HEPN/Toprim-associated domain-containing protein [Candidatus Paceibacterota bacterium]|jgi:hypothetical protein